MDELRLTFLGDIAATGILSTDPQINHLRFKDLLNHLASSDLVIANLEVPVKVDASENEYKNRIHFSLPDPTRELLKLLNVGMVSLANNHVYDCKMPGLKETINILEDLDIRHTGAGWDQKQIEPIIKNIKGKKIAFLAFVDKSTNPETEHYTELYINYLELSSVIDEIRIVKTKADLIIVSLHWGVDYSFYPTSDQQFIARQLIDEGANVILGHHPHTLQPYEIYKGSPIFYSLGTFCFGDIQKDYGLHSLPIKTKKGSMIHYNMNTKEIQSVGFRIARQSFLVLSDFDFAKWSKKKMSLFSLKARFRIIHKLILIKEIHFERIFNFFFGYYKKPFKTLFSEQLFGKVMRSSKEFRRQNELDLR